MTKCIDVRIPKKKICAGDMRNRIEIMLRTQTSPGIGKGLGPVETFTPYTAGFFGIRSANGSNPISGVNINEEATHIFISRYTTKLALLDTTKHFPKFRNKYYRILEISNLNEDNLTIFLQCKLLGITDKKASEA